MSSFQEVNEREGVRVVLFVDGREVDMQVLLDGLHGLYIAEIGVGIVEDEKDIIRREEVGGRKLHDAGDVFDGAALGRG